MRSVSAFNYPARADLVTLLGYGAVHINPNTYRWNAITSVNLSGTIYQAMCYWTSAGKLTIATRTLDGAWTEYAQAAISTPGDDNHDTCAIGIDPNGYIHVCYAMHADALLYRKSNAAINSWTGTLGNVIAMLGTNESAVTYPAFFNDPAGNLYAMFRDGGSGNGDLYMYKYNHATPAWVGVAGTTAGKLIDGKSESPTVNAYFDHPCFDANFGSGGYFHLSWHNKTYTEQAGTSKNRNKSYVKWDGTTWKKADGSSQTIPITQANSEIIDNNNTDDLYMTSFNSLFSDNAGHPHLVYSKTGAGFRRLYHAYHNGSSWTISQITTTPLSGSDLSPGEIGLIPSIAIARATNTVYVLYRDNSLGSGIRLLKSTNFTSWIDKEIYPYNVGWYTPKFDYVEFDRSGLLYLAIEEYFGSLLVGAQASFPIYCWKVNPAIW